MIYTKTINTNKITVWNMKPIKDIKLNLCESVNFTTANKIMTCICKYTNNQIRLYKMTSSDSYDTRYKYDLYIDGSNEYMKRKPLKQEIKNLEQFINGVIYTMNTFA